MPVNWENTDEVNAFRDYVISNGADPMETDKYISSQKETNLQPIPKTEQLSVPEVKLEPVQKPIEPVVQQVTPQPAPRVEQASAPMQPTILGGQGRLGTAAGVRQSADVFSKGINWGRDVAIENGTPVAVPQGDWKVLDAYGNATRTGRIGDGTNKGYGNSVLLQNMQTGEKVRMSHLSPGVAVRTGQQIKGGTVIGRTGQTGNTSGPHLDIEYYDRSGKIRDIMQSPYGRQLMGEI